MKRKIGVLLLIVSLLAGCSVSVITYPRYGSLEAFVGIPYNPNIPAPQNADLLVESEELEIIPLNYEREHLYPLKHAKVTIDGIPGETDHEGILRMYRIPVGIHEFTVEHECLNDVAPKYIQIHEGKNGPENIRYGGVGYFLSIGVEHNQQCTFIANGAADDAQRFHNELKNNNTLYAAHKLLQNEQARKSDILDEITGFVNTSHSEDDYLVIYFAGRMGRDFLSPYDDDPFGSWDRKTTIKDADLKRSLSGFKGDVTLILEGTQSASFFDGERMPYEEKREPLAFQGTDYTVIASAIDYSYAEDLYPYHGIFTDCFIEAIRHLRRENRQDGLITAGAVFDYVEPSVWNRTIDGDYGPQSSAIYKGSNKDNVIYRYRY